LKNNLNIKTFLNKLKTNSRWALYMLLFILLVWYWFCLPKPLFTDPTSTVIYSSNNRLLGAMIADDGQWRFPENNEIPDKFKQCILQFEDRHFYWHFGFNPYSLARSLIVNLDQGRKVLGGSTLTMQLVRISRKGQDRTVFEKLKELIQATRAELRYSKKEILSLYASHAPFGSNVVGLEAASWRYFGRSSSMLSWAETAMLAVLPNSPSLIFPGKNHQKLLLKRNRLLMQLYKAKIIDKDTYTLSLLESIPAAPLPIPVYAPHLLSRVYSSADKGKPIVTTLDAAMQQYVTDIVERHVEKLTFNGVRNAAVLVADVETGNVLAYIGNARAITQSKNGNSVDIINSERSTGSILKPFLYAAMLDDGLMLPTTLVPDVPVLFAGYSPKNFSKTFDGAVHANMALARSLNVPAVMMLKEYNYDRFYALLRKCGMTTLNYPAGHYGLSLILGGAEGKLWDIAGMYASMARSLNHFHLYSGLYYRNDFRPLNFKKEIVPPVIKNEDINLENKSLSKKGTLSAASMWFTFNALLEVNRPEEETGWENFLSSKRIAWKTGTSFGFRDGWAVGTTPHYVVAVWVGNADGEGRPGLTGSSCAAPILFDIFQYLSGNEWFEPPYDEMTRVPICTLSGCRATNLCTPVDSAWVPNSGLKTAPCPYHKLIHLDALGKYRVSSDCVSVSNMQHIPYFVLPAVQEWYYKWKNTSYKPVPPWMPGCNDEQESMLEFIYPKENAKVFVPIDIDNQKSKVIAEVAHRRVDATLYWHLDGAFIGVTRGTHQMGLTPDKGKHHLVVVDELGNSIERNFTVQ